MDEGWLKVVSRRIKGAQVSNNDNFLVENRFSHGIDADIKALGALYTSNIR